MGSRKSWGKGQYHEGRQRGSSLRVLPFIPLGISKPKPATYSKTEREKKEKRKKKSTYGVIDNYKKWKTHTHTKINPTNTHTKSKPFPAPPTPNTSLFSFFPSFL